MATIPASENEFPQLLLAEGAAPSTPATGLVVAYAKSDGLLYWKDDAGNEYAVGQGDTAGHIADASDAHDASAISVLDSGANFTGTDVEAVLAELQDNIDAVGGASFAGKPVVLTAAGLPIDGGSGSTTNSTANLAWALPFVVPGPMKVRGLSMLVSSSAAGAHEWGLFDYTSSLAAATKVAGGSAAPGGTGWRSIAAASAPVDVGAGAYILILKAPAATVSAIGVCVASTAIPYNQVHTSYTWDDTPDLLAVGWAPNTTYPIIYLEGDLDASGNRWV